MTDLRAPVERAAASRRPLRRRRGLTIIELLLVLALFGVLAAMTAPSIATYLARKRVDGTAQEVATTVRYARALRLQSPQRTLDVFLGISSGTGFTCVGVYLSNTASLCDCGRTTTDVCSTNALLTRQPEMLRMLRLQTSEGVSVTPTASTTIMQFDRHTALPFPSGSTLSSTISSSRGGTLRVDIGPTGLPLICEVRGTGYPTLHPAYDACP